MLLKRQLQLSTNCYSLLRAPSVIAFCVLRRCSTPFKRTGSSKYQRGTPRNPFSSCISIVLLWAVNSCAMGEEIGQVLQSSRLPKEVEVERPASLEPEWGRGHQATCWTPVALFLIDVASIQEYLIICNSPRPRLTRSQERTPQQPFGRTNGSVSRTDAPLYRESLALRGVGSAVALSRLAWPSRS